MIMSYRSALRHLLYMPPQPSQRARQSATLTAGVLYAIIIISLVEILILPGNSAQDQVAPAVFLLILGLLIGTIGLALLKRGHAQAAAWIVTVLIWIVVATMSIHFGGVTAPGFTYFGLAILVAMLVLRHRAALIISGLIGLTSLGIFLLDVSGQLRQPSFTHSDAFFVAAGHFLLTALIVYIASRTLDRSLEEIQSRDQQLKLAERRFRSMIEHSHDGIFLADSEMIMRYMTPSVQRILGYTEDELIGRQRMDLIHPDDTEHMASVFEAVMREPSKTISTSLRARHKSGTWRYLDAQGTNLLHDPGVAAIVVSLRDATERRELEARTLQYEVVQAEMRKEQELVKVKERFISVVSHELRTPLAVITSSGELLHRYADRMDASRQQEHVAQILESAATMRAMMEEMLTLSRLQQSHDRFQPRPHDIRVLCQTIVNQVQLSQPAARQIDVSADEKLGQVHVDEHLFQHILVNLLSNALKYSPEDSVVALRVQAAGDELVIEVEDHGMGIPAEDQPRLFEPFHRAANVGSIQGTGLGLAIVKENVLLHGGTISFTSTQGVGTTFTVRLPLLAG
jgi:PAS domain S-box-containing protein